MDNVNRWAIGIENHTARPNTRRKHLETPRQGQNEFGAVFKRATIGGPVSIDEKIPGWKYPTRPGNTDANESAKSIMSKWTPEMHKRFRMFVDSFKSGSEGMTPWKQEWLDKTAPGHDKDREKILKCKIELIRRLLKIKVVGTETLEDWILLFLYHDRYILIPPDIETLVNPYYSKQNLQSYFKDGFSKTPKNMKYFYTPAVNSVDNPANLSIPGFGSPHLPEFDMYGLEHLEYPTYYGFWPTDEDSRLDVYRFVDNMMTTFPAAIPNRVFDEHKHRGNTRRRWEFREVQREPRIITRPYSKYSDIEQGRTANGPA